MADEIVIDEYTLINHIATGSSTQVWEVIEKGGGDRRGAMKVLLPEALAVAEQRNVLKHEAKLTERFEHPNLVRFQKLVMNKKRGYMLMDYFRAPNLKTQLQADLPSVQVRITRLIEQLCQVLGYLHDLGWVHRDIKPDNILFNKASEVRLIDFSLTTRAAGAVSKLIGGKEKVIQGTRTYISPETILKAPPAPPADIYSLGITLFEILAGEPPFRGNSPDDLLKKHLVGTAPPPSAFNENVTPEMDRMILKMLSKRVKDRHKNTHEVLAEFRNIKPFKEDAGERDRRLKREAEERYKTSLDRSGRLDSRADHFKQRVLAENPELARQDAELKKARAKEEADKKKALAERAKKTLEKEQAAETAKAGGSSKGRAAASSQPAAAPAPPPAPAMPAYPQAMAPYGYPGYAPMPYPMAGYPPAPAYPQAGYPVGVPPGAYPQGAYHPAQMPQQPAAMAPQRPAPPQQAPQPGPQQRQQPQAPAPNVPRQQPGSVLGSPPPGPAANSPPPGLAAGSSPSGPAAGTPQRAAPVPASPNARPAAPPAATPRPASAPRPATASQPAGQPAIAEQQQLLQQLLGQPAAAPPGTPPAARSDRGQPAQSPPAAPGGAKELPLMDQLPPVK